MKLFLDIVFFDSLASPHAVLSAIFGILGKFWVDIGVQKNSEILFSRWKFFLEKYVFEKSQNSIGISMIPFKRVLKGIIEIPIEFWNFFKIFQKFSKNFENIFFEIFFHLEKNLKIFLNTYVNSKFVQDSKNRT